MSEQAIARFTQIRDAGLNMSTQWKCAELDDSCIVAQQGLQFKDEIVSCCAFYLATDSILNSIVMDMEQQAICKSTKSPRSLHTHRRSCLLHYHKRLASVMNFCLVYVVREFTERFLAPGLSDNQLYLVLAELVTSAAVTPLFSASKSAATFGQTVSKELHSQTFWLAQ